MNNNRKPLILVVEDEEISKKNLQRILTKQGYEVIPAQDGAEAIDLLKRNEFDLVLTDLKMKQIDGMEVLKTCKELHPHTEVIIITGYATVDSAVKAMREGAYYYLAKPFKLDELRKITHEALMKRSLTIENQRLKEVLKNVKTKLPEIIGKSSSMVSVLKLVDQVAVSDSNVLILGESGTGKELIARRIHYLSPRAANNFIAFNCGVFSEELMTNELFGHEKEAYTGAYSSKKGLLETADGGTVFLDEIGDMPLSLQVKLLRVIQEKSFMRVGGTKLISVDVRFISATHRDLEEDVKEERFRQDLFYRLNVITIKVPPLRERVEDIPVLVNYFIAKKSKEFGKDIKEIDSESMDLLCLYSWPGNVRELENVVERAVVLAKRDKITPELLPEYIQSLSIESYKKESTNIPTLEEQEKRYILWVLERCNGNKSKAAKLMGIDRVSLWRKLKRYGIQS